MKNSILRLTATCGLAASLWAQVGVGTNAPHASAILDVESSDRGFLPPRLASDGDVAGPADGLVIYDESDDCLNVFAAGEWKDLCSDGGDNTDNLVGVGWQSPLRFDQVIPPNTKDNSKFVTYALGKDGILYGWGYDNAAIIQKFDASAVTDTSVSPTGTIDFLATPWRLSDDNFDGQIKQIATFDGRTMVLKNNGELYSFGNNKFNFVSATASNVANLVNPTLKAPPVAGQKITDVHVSDDRVVIVTDDGKAYFIGKDYTGSSTYKIWQEIPTPTSAPAGFEFTEIMDSEANENETLIFKSNSGDIYAIGSSILNSRLLGSNQTVSSGLRLLDANHMQKIDFPASAGEIMNIDIAGQTAVAFDNMGNTFAWGLYGSSTINGDVNAPMAATNFVVDSSQSPIFTQTGLYRFITDPVLLELPDGETSFVDFDRERNINSYGTYFVGASGKVYYIGRPDSSIEEFNIFVGNDNSELNYVQSANTSHLDVAEIHHHTGYVGVLDKQGAWYYFGDNQSAYIGSFDKPTTATSTSINAYSSTAVIATPLQDGLQDGNNLRP